MRDNAMTEQADNDTFIASFVPNPLKYSSAAIHRGLKAAFAGGEVTTSSTIHEFSHREYRFEGGRIVFTSLRDPVVNYLVVRTHSPEKADSAISMLEAMFDRATTEQLRNPHQDYGHLQLWAVADLGNPRPDELEKQLWENSGSSRFEDRLNSAEAAHILGTPRALLALEICALVELGPIRALFESYLAGTHRRSLQRESRVLMDPAVPLETALEDIHSRVSVLPISSVESSVGYASTYFEWRGDADLVYVIDTDHPKIRWLGFDGANTGLLEDFESVSLSEGIERASAEADWLRGAANTLSAGDEADFVEALDALATQDANDFALAFSAIESALPEARQWLAERIGSFDDRLVPIVRAAGIA